MRPPKRRLLLLLCFAALTVAVGPLCSAQAATYAVWTCADSHGKPLSTGDYVPSTVGLQVSATSTCGVNATGGTAGNLQALAGGGPGQPDTTESAAWSVTAASGTAISALDVWWTNSASVQIPGRVQITAGSTSLYARDAGSFGNVATPFDDAANRQSFTGLSAPSASLDAWCLSGCARPDRAISAIYNVYRIRTTVTDSTAPTGRATGITEGQIIAGPVAVQAQASDVGGGVKDLELVVDGRVIDSKSAGGQCDDIDPTAGDANDYLAMKPCPATLPTDAPATFTVTPAILASPGAHTVAVVAHDAAGNAGTLSSSTVVVAPATFDGAPPPGRYDSARNLFFNPDLDLTSPARPNGINASGGANVSLSFVVKHTRRIKGHRRVVKTFSKRRTVGYSRSARMRIVLKTPGGVPIIAARVYRATSVAGGPWELAAKPILTSKTGRATMVLPARSPSRRVQIVYFPTTDSNASARSRSTLLAVHAPVSLSLSQRVVPHGGRLNLTARLRAGRRAGKSVLGVLQARRGGKWQTIRQLRFRGTRGGRGVAKIALRPRGPSSYSFRVVVAAQESLRYTRGVSVPRRVRVR